MSDDAIKQRWRKPSTPLATADVHDVATADLGRATLEHTERWSPDEIERRRLGYVCIKCWEPHEAPFPEACALCGFPMRERQAEEFDRIFRGVQRDPKAALIERELDRIDDVHERRYYETNSGIVIPRGVN